MNPVKLLLIAVLLVPTFSQAQFGPKKKDLQLQIDTLKRNNEALMREISAIQSQDSISFSELKRMGNEMRDLKKLMIELNGDIRKLKLDNEHLANQYNELKDKVEKHERLIKNVIGGDSTEIEEHIDDDETSIEIDERLQNFAEFAEEFISVIKKDGELALKNYLIEKGSFYYLSKPGFITSVAEITDINELTEEIPWRVGLDAFRKSKFSLIEGEKPEINCDMADLYNKRGCYGGLEQSFTKVSKALIALKEFSPDDVSKLNGQIGEIKQSEKEVVSFIYSTDGNLGFYFIKKDETWKLYCLEVEDPCSA